MSGAEFERVTLFYPAYDRRAEGYGIHGVDLLMLLTGPLGAVQFKLSTGWLLPETVGVDPASDRIGYAIHAYGDGLKERNSGLSCYPMPSDLGFHSPRPMYEGHDSISEECEYVPGGGRCYYDGTGLGAALPFYALVRGGSEGVWEFLEGWYRTQFEDAPFEAFPNLAASGSAGNTDRGEGA